MTAYTEIAVYMVVVNVSTCVFSKLDLDVAGRFIHFPLKKIKIFNINITCRVMTNQNSKIIDYIR